MSSIINVTPDSDGRVIIELYGEKIEIDDSMFNNKGVATIKHLGEEYEIHKPSEATISKKVSKKTTGKDK